MAPMDASRDVDDSLLDFGFNQDATCFACGTTSGFRIFSCEPYKKQFRRDFETGGIGGGGVTPRFPPTNVMIWDDDQRKCIAELSFRSQVRSVRLRRDRIVVCQESKVSVYNFADLQLLHSIETGPNPRGHISHSQQLLVDAIGLVAVSSDANSTVLACPGLQAGKVRVELYDRSATRFICAHDSALSSLELSLDGRILATASERGTLIRVWNTNTTNILQEVRRGLDTAVIFSIAISRNCDYLAVSSDKGTVHVFPLRCFTSPNEAQEKENADQPSALSHTMTSMLSYVKGIVPLPNYFQSEWSLAQFRVPEDCWSVVAFGQSSHSLYVLNQKGSFYTIEFDPVKGLTAILEQPIRGAVGGPCTQKSYHNFLEVESAQIQ